MDLFTGNGLDIELVKDGANQDAGRLLHEFKQVVFKGDERGVPQKRMIRVKQMTDKGHTFRRARGLAPAQTSTAEIYDWARMTAYLVAGEIRDIRGPQSFTKQVQGIHEAVDFGAGNIS